MMSKETQEYITEKLKRIEETDTLENAWRLANDALIQLKLSSTKQTTNRMIDLEENVTTLVNKRNLILP